jgi:hypothetical protein
VKWNKRANKLAGTTVILNGDAMDILHTLFDAGMTKDYIENCDLSTKTRYR